MKGQLRKYPGAPELLVRGNHGATVLDYVAVYRARWSGRSLVDFLRPFIDDGSYHWKGRVAPASPLTAVPKFGSIEDQFSLKPGSFLTTISGVSDQPDGFRWKLTDRASGSTIGSDWVQHIAGNGGLGTKFPTRPLPFYLTSPWTVGESGLLTIQIRNLSPATNNIQMLFAFAEPNK